MSGLLLALLVSSVPVPAECEAPPARDVTLLKAVSSVSGDLSVGLDSIATWCFDAEGAWSGGARAAAPAPAKGKKPGKGAVAPAPAPPSDGPVGDCAKAVAACETARSQLTEGRKQLLLDVLADLKVPFHGATYTPRRSGLLDHPSDAADCQSHVRSELYVQAQARMDYARLASQAQNEYANYRTWLYSQSLRCAEGVSAPPESVRRGISVDATVAQGSAMVFPDAGPSLDAGAPAPLVDAGALVVAVPFVVPPPDAGAPEVPVDRAGLLLKWRGFAAARAPLEADRDWATGFSRSRELRDCHCDRVSPQAWVKRLESGDNVPALALDDPRATRCEQCVEDIFTVWRQRADKQCALMFELSDFELGVLERSDDGNGLPPRCFEAARARRGSDAGLVTVTRPPPFVTVPTPASAPTVAPPSAGVTVSSPIADTFVRAQDYAPVPLRDEGRLYLRVFLSSACVAEVLPGPVQARTGDLLPVPPGTPRLSVKSACGGLAEVYWGREAKPRVSELFGRNQPLVLEFKPQ
jgi:hypothetical protein